ncbi:DUF5719 family protein [Dermatobacter hominis]|uniref:DUF5719 family protein n=1 Tax=Dermatobacter hominis TaxID=2884263 RepID=UPI001D12D0ED|nr:DUF5719 family protein [Dermatobacter hominis]UDY35609.1 DUF5719 family protein [Dermatobacter hominis]
MRPARLAVLTVVVLALVGLAAAWGGRDEPEAAAIDRAPVPAVRADGDLPVTWYCAAGTAAVPTRHFLYLSNPDGDATTARITGYTAAGATPPRDVEVPPGGPLPVDVGALVGDPTASVLVQSPNPQLTVDHQLVAEGYGDRAACVGSTSGEWHFPSLSTTRDAGARLTLFNPFPGDAGVDVEIGFDTGTRVPTSVNGVVVPAGTVKVIDLGQQGIAERRDQFTAVVRSRSGRVLAEVAQTWDGSVGPEGLQLAGGVPEPQERWAFAGGFTGAGAAERLVLENPGDARANVLVQVTPYGGASAPPEPLEVAVEPRRYAVVDLSAESRIPGVGYHSIEVESDHPVVAARTSSLTGGPDPSPDPAVLVRPALTSGVAISNGTPVLARTWVVPSIDAGRDPAPVVLVHNPGEGIAKVTLTAVAAGAETELTGATDLEVAPGDSVAVPLAAAGAAPEITVRVSASEPVVVERITVFDPDDDLAFDLAVPVHTAGEPLRGLGG